ncbi:MAG: 2-octaprenyl-6-methoxyphenyl hydroxylase [Cellvibrionaceae bacterium]
MVGICLAILLAQKKINWSITLIESFPLALSNKSAESISDTYQPSFDSRSTAIAAGSKDILEQSGIWKTLKNHVSEISKVHVSDKNHFGGSLIEAKDYDMHAVGYVVENAWFGKVLMAELSKYKNINIIAPASVKKLTPQKNGYRIDIQSQNDDSSFEKNTLDKKISINAELTVIADGANSALSQQIGIQVEEKNYHQHALIANVECDKPHNGVAYERFTDQGPIALLPLCDSKNNNKTMALVWTLPENNQLLIDCDEGKFLEQLQNRFGFRQGHFVRVSQRFQYPLKLQLAKEQVRRSLVLMGNAAHFLHPVAGQGFNLALRDCYSLSAILESASKQNGSIGDLNVLQQYIQAQHVDQLATVSLSDNFVEWFSSSSATKSVLRNIGLLALDALPGATPMLAKRTMGLT